MAATEGNSANSVVRALTAAALLLPGIELAVAQPAATASVQATRFEEGKRATSVESGLTPLQAWTLAFHARQPLTDSLSVDLDLVQDTWSGATPVTIAPVDFGGNRPRRIDSNGTAVVSGASPILNGFLALDGALQPLARTARGETRNELIMASASPEIRQEASAAIERDADWHRQQLTLSYSHEPDFISRHIGVRESLDLAAGRTTLAVGAGYTDSRVAADLSGSWLPYVTTALWQDNLSRSGNQARVDASADEHLLNLGLTQILSRGALLDIGISVREARGFLESPYRTVTAIFVDPATLASPRVTGDVRALLEQRPDSRVTRAFSARYVQHIAPLNAALHVNYDYSRDDWQIESHAFELQWLQPVGAWLVAPRWRWYSQGAAWFHQDYMVSTQRYRSIARDTAGRELWFDAADANRRYFRTSDGRFLDVDGAAPGANVRDLVPQFTLFSPALLPAQYSSDPRLGGFGVQSAGLTLQRQFENGLRLEASVDRYRRASSLQWNGSGDTPYADYHYTTASVALTLDLQTVARRRQQSAAHHHHGSALPAGLMLSHAAGSAGTLSTGYRAETQRSMTMHMLDLVWHPAERWSLLLMPQFMTMPPDHAATTHGDAHSDNAFADTLVAAVWHQPTAAGEWQFTTGFGVPGSGKGSADFLPALLYQTAQGSWQFGTQLRGQFHLEPLRAGTADPRRSLSSTAWIGHALTPSLTTTLRAQHRVSDHPSTGRFTEVGIGAGVVLDVDAQSFAFEWLVPLSSRGTPLEYPQQHALVARWHIAL